MCLDSKVRHPMIEQMSDNENGDNNSSDSMYLFHATKVSGICQIKFDLNQIFSLKIEN